MQNINALYNQQKKQGQVIGLEKGKIPPQAIDLEQAVLGAMMIDKKGLDQVIDILSPEIFYKTEHQEIYSAIQKLFNDSQPIDLLTVSNQLKLNGKLDFVGGDFYLVTLSQKVSSSAHIEYHSRVIQEKYILRKLIEVSSGIIQEAYDDTTDVFQLLDTSENNLFEITNGSLKKSYESSADLVSQAIAKITEMSKKEGMSGVPSGFAEIDRVTSGWQDSDLVILAARPGMGKTAFVLSMARSIAVESKTPVALFSLEMSSVQLITRLISSETGIEASKLRKATLADHEWKQLYARVKALEEAPIFIDDTPALSIFDLRAKCRRLVSQHQVKIIIIDYLQLMTAGASASGNREQEISMISRSLKAIAKELEVPVIALSQLSRAVETRGGSKRPLLSDLRESGAIEQDADIVSFIYRPSYYGLDAWDDEQGTPCAGQAEFIIAKHRNGSLENVRLGFVENQAKFENLQDNNFSMGQFESSMNASLEPIRDLSQFSSDPASAFGVDQDSKDEDFPF
ncbi:MAG: replicative DNA helicase [Flavobacteriaceae bacterium]|nr:MAG: replicative DNA helicase [Flavobacteriaceae bacterium]